MEGAMQRVLLFPPTRSYQKYDLGHRADQRITQTLFETTN